jgi:hypothetical protein
MRMRQLIASLLLIAVLPAAVPAQELRSGTTGTLAIVNVPLANVRQEPLTKSRILTQVLFAEPVRVLAKEDYWYRIAAPDQGGIEGWVNAVALLLLRDDAFFSDEHDWVVVATPKTRARVRDRLGDQPVSLYGGTRLPVVKQDASSFLVRFPDRRTVAVLPAADVLPVRRRNPLFAAAAPSAVAGTARKFVGVRFLAGGVTEQGMDTRGLIRTVYRIHGMDLDMDRGALLERAVAVTKKELLPGDVLLFRDDALGLYVGNGRFLHAPRRGRVSAGGIGDRRYAAAFETGLRLLVPDGEYRKRPAEMTADEIMVTQGLAAELPLGGRIAYWAERFVGTPYDTDPLGLYVRTRRIVADEAVDCMYLTFRAVELATSATPGEAVAQGLHRRFLTEGRMADGLVENYAERFEYGEDMVFSGKWGRNITGELGKTAAISGSRGRERVVILPKETLATKRFQQQLRDGDVIYWVKDPKKRVVGEIVAHLAFIRVKDGAPYLVHASGSKSKWSTPDGGKVKEVPFAEYLRGSKFVGAFVTRFKE